MKAAAIDSPWLTSREAIAYLRLGSRSALQRLIDQHRLPHGRRGSLLLFDRRKLDAWVEGEDGQLALVPRKRSA